jgi:PAS domain-containing protein
MTREDARHFRRKIVGLMRAKEGFKGFEVPGFRSDKSVVWQRLNGTPIIGEDGEVAGFRGVAHDITAQKEAQNAVERSERKFRDLIEGSIQGLVIHRRYQPLFVNDAYAKMAGYKNAEELMAKLDSLLDLLPADFVRKSDEFW